MVSEDDRRKLPSVSKVLNDSRLSGAITVEGHQRVAEWIREVLEEQRASLKPEDQPVEVLDRVVKGIQSRQNRSSQGEFGPVINATGVILHTSLGRAPLSQAAVEAMMAASGTANLEIDLGTGERRTRGYQLDELWTQLTGCESSLVVNNNAAATLLTLTGLCAGREVLISRGQLIEIGGSFRLPEIFTLGGVQLREVGTTNRTHLEDYRRAITPATAALLKVHPSNYRISGFACSPNIGELVELAHAHGLLAIDDIGSGSLIEIDPEEPTFPGSIRAGADLVLGSGDKLLGGPQSGIILGKKSVVDLLRSHPLARALRIDKLTLAALSATLLQYARGSSELIPVWRMMQATKAELRSRAQMILELAAPSVEPLGIVLNLIETEAEVGGGSLPGVVLETVAISIQCPHTSCDELAARLRTGQASIKGNNEPVPVKGNSQQPRLIPRIQNGVVLIDLRSVLPEQDQQVAHSILSIIELKPE